MLGDLPCCLCQAKSGDRVCRDCHRDLPWLINACPRCGLPAMNGFCGACSVRPPPWKFCAAPFIYAHPINRIVHAFKYSEAVSWGRWLGQEMARRVWAQGLPLPDFLLPVPVSPEGLVQRGFNQSLVLAHAVGRELDLPVRHHLIFRNTKTRHQVGLGARERDRNIRGAFVVMPAPPPGSRIGVVDDILTTGATAAEITQVLLRQGAAEVQWWVAARTLLRQ